MATNNLMQHFLIMGFINQESKNQYLSRKSYQRITGCTGVTEDTSKLPKVETQDEVIADYFRMMNKNNGWAMAYTLTEEFFGISEDELTDILEEQGVEDEG